MLAIENEKQFIDSVALALKTLQGYDAPKVVHRRVNLATKRFEDIWQVWWKSKLPPKLEVDLVLAFENVLSEIDEALLVGVEVKYFRFDKGGRIKLNFYEGLQQALAYALFGFDGISLWHVFHCDLSEDDVKSYAQTMKQLIDEFKLPIFYLATQLVTQENEIKLKCFAPTSLFEPQELDYFMRWMKNYFTSKDYCNPMSKDPEVQRRRKALKTLLQIPA
jgi:hypothetical protein